MAVMRRGRGEDDRSASSPRFRARRYDESARPSSIVTRSAKAAVSFRVIGRRSQQTG
jgi:hypothetical protein